MSRCCNTEPCTPGKMLKNCLGCMLEAASGPILSTRPSIMLTTGTPVPAEATQAKARAPKNRHGDNRFTHITFNKISIYM